MTATNIFFNFVGFRYSPPLASIAHYFELFDKNIFITYILSKHLYKLSFKFENIWMHRFIVMMDFIQVFTCIKLENRRRLVQLHESLMDHISATAYTRDLLQILECSSLHAETLCSKLSINL